jgi:hypothetical protein
MLYALTSHHRPRTIFPSSLKTPVSMSSATTPTNLSCGRCHTAEADLGSPLQQCAGCHSIRYCGRDCQRNDRARHKSQCRSIRDGGSSASVPIRTTMRMNLGAFRGSNNTSAQETESENIYHLMTSFPHLWDITSSGPYDTLEAAALQAIHNFGRECSTGID